MIRNDVFRERESYMSLLERERETRRYISNRLSTKIYKCSSICFSLYLYIERERQREGETN